MGGIVKIPMRFVVLNGLRVHGIASRIQCCSVLIRLAAIQGMCVTWTEYICVALRKIIAPPIISVAAGIAALMTARLKPLGIVASALTVKSKTVILIAPIVKVAIHRRRYVLAGQASVMVATALRLRSVLKETSQENV